jgi:hypothetical protein
MMLRITIDVSGTPSLTMRVDKKINIVKVMVYYVDLKVTIVPKEG